MKIAKTNIFSANKCYVQGKAYSDQEVAHLDPNDFETVHSEKKEIVQEQPKSLTTESIKPKRIKK